MLSHRGRPFVCRPPLLAAIVLAAVPAISSPGQLSPWSASSLENDSRKKDAPARRFAAKVETVNPVACDPATTGRARQSAIDAKGTQKAGRERLASEAYGHVLDLYAGAARTAGIEAVRALEERTLTSALTTLNRVPGDARAPWTEKRFALAIMLHTEAGLQTADASEMRRHLQIAADFLQVAAQCAPVTIAPLAPRWYVAVSRLLRERGTTETVQAADGLLGMARARLGEHADILYESGTLAEAFATTWLTSAADLRLAWTNDDQRIMRLLRERRAGQLGDAAQWLSRAAALAPGRLDVHLHLGRVRALTFDDDQALSILDDVLRRTSDATVAYMAQVFIAAVHDRSDRYDEAIAAYRDALVRWPRGHAARMGLANALRRAGQTSESRSDLMDFVSPAAARDRREPLWWYQFEPPGDAEARVEALAAEVRQ